MSIVQTQVNHSQEVDSLFALLQSIAVDAKAKKSVIEISADAVPKLISVLSGLNSIGADLTADKKAVETSVADGLVGLLSVITGG